MVPSDPAADLELIRRALAGGVEAGDRLARRLLCVRAFVRRRNARLGTPLGADEVEDVVQNTLMAVWGKLDRFAGYGSLEAWLSRFAALEFAALLRSRRRGPSPTEGLEETAVEPSTPDPQLLELERVYRGLDELGPPENDVIRLKLLEGLTFEEVAERLTTNVNTAKARYYRGLRRLRGLVAVAGPPGRRREADT